jgi:hypothetical protein
MNLLKNPLRQDHTESEQVKLQKSEANDMSVDRVDHAWNLMVELRKELVEAQKIRSQIIEVKITFVSAGIGVIAAHTDTVPIQLLVIPALAAIFFDLLINSYGFSIKRIGCYCRCYIEPHLEKVFENSGLPRPMLLWEGFLVQHKKFRQNLGLWGNLGLTGLAIIVATIALFIRPDWRFSIPLLIIMAVLFMYDIVSFRRTDEIAYQECPSGG